MDQSGRTAEDFPDEDLTGPAPLAQGKGAPDRIGSLDFIRGFAVLGILAANTTGYALANIETGWPAAFGPLSAGERWLWLADFLLVDGKMRSLFAILFGAGLVLFMERVDAKGGFGAGLQVRRLFWLFLFGLMHFFLLFRGDILMAYALWGLAAMMLAGAKPGLLLALGGALYIARVPAFAFEYAGALDPASLDQLPYWMDMEAMRADGLLDIAAMQGGLLEIIAYKADRYFLSAMTDAGGAFFDSFPMMLIGMACFRLGLFGNEAGSKLLRMWGWVLAMVGLAAGAALAWQPLMSGFAPGEMRFYTTALSPLQRLPMILAWLFLLLGYLPSLAGGWIGERVAAAGRMAFSNYIGTSLVMAIIFQGWGLSLFGRFDRIELFGFVLLGWALMLAWSKPWLAYFRFGPLEWAWRCLTYGEKIPLRR